MIDVIATATASKLLEALAAEGDLPEDARRLLLRAVNRLDDQLKRRLWGKPTR